jgi:ABC-2 type transport system permease protein
MGAVYMLTLRQLSGRWRLLIMTVLAMLPVILALLNVNDDDAQSVASFEMATLSTVLAGSIIPLIVLAIAAAAFANEVEDRTLANLTLAPLPRWKIVVPKLLGSVTIAAPFIGVSAFATSYVAFLGDAAAVASVTIASIASVVLYAAVFLWLGLVTSQAIGAGLLYIVLWEGFFSGYVAGVRLLSIRHYATALMHGFDPRRFASATHPGMAVTLIIMTAVLVGFIWLAVRRLRRMDVP